MLLEEATPPTLHLSSPSQGPAPTVLPTPYVLKSFAIWSSHHQNATTCSLKISTLLCHRQPSHFFAPIAAKLLKNSSICPHGSTQTAPATITSDLHVARPNRHFGLPLTRPISQSVTHLITRSAWVFFFTWPPAQHILLMSYWLSSYTFSFSINSSFRAFHVRMPQFIPWSSSFIL